MRGVSTEPETPVTEATVTDEEAEYRARIPFEVIFTRRASFDPSPELRERVESLRPSKDRFLSAYEEGRRDAIHDVLDVLDALKGTQ